MDRDHPFRSYYSLAIESLATQQTNEEEIHSVALGRRWLRQVDIRFVIVGSFVVAFICNFVISWWFNHLLDKIVTNNRFRDTLALFMLGLKLSELVAIGFLWALGSWHVGYRSLYAGFSVVVLTSGLILGFRGTGMQLEVVLLLFIAAAIVELVTVFAAAITSWMTSWGLVRVRSEIEQLDSQTARQFDTRFLFKVMIAVAISIPILQLCFRLSAFQIMAGPFPWFAAVVWLVWLAVGLTLYCSVQSVSFLVPKAWTFRIAFLCLVLLGPFLFQWIASQLVRGSIFNFRMTAENLLLAYSLSAGLTIGTCLFFLFLRLLGFRLQR